MRPLWQITTRLMPALQVVSYLGPIGFSKFRCFPGDIVVAHPAGPTTSYSSGGNENRMDPEHREIMPTRIFLNEIVLRQRNQAAVLTRTVF
jgi:hypothetical protein